MFAIIVIVFVSFTVIFSKLLDKFPSIDFHPSGNSSVKETLYAMPSPTFLTVIVKLTISPWYANETFAVLFIKNITFKGDSFISTVILASSEVCLYCPVAQSITFTSTLFVKFP